MKCYKNSYDIGKFLTYHPGGFNYLQNYENKNVERRMRETNHSTTAYYLLREYEIDGRDVDQHEDNEDLEHLVDWNKPMLSQIGKLGTKYNQWVTLPVDRELRLFGNPLIENLTKTPWFLVPIIWLPVIVVFLHIGWQDYTKSTRQPIHTSILSAIGLTAFGVVIWTLLEYTIHRWVFHKMPSGHSKAQIVFHFITHGLHHKVPFDHKRLVFPPFPAAIVGSILLAIYSKIFPGSVLFLVAGGTALGYVTYDMIHFYLHYGSPKENTFLYNMKRYHNQHHFVHQDTGFGISNKTWDYFFGTLINLKKLAMPIKWSTCFSKNK